MSRLRRCIRVGSIALAAAAVWLPRPVGAQGTLSVQGLGYPSGQLSTQAGTMGGSIGEMDPFSPLNPAALGLMSTPLLYFQAEPEYRVVTMGDQRLRSSVMRFPVFLGGLPLGERWWVALSASTLLDRTWETAQRDTQFVRSDTLAGTITDRSEGSISDLRLAVAYMPVPWLRIGIGGHGFSGRDVLRTTRSFDDSTRFAGTQQSTSLSFGGNAVSIGAQTIWPRIGAVALSYRHGGTLRVYNGEDVLGSGSVPDHIGISVAYLGLRGATLAARAAHDDWSSLRGATSAGTIHEGWDLGVGADVTGPRFGPSPVAFRAGARWRTLPFSVAPAAVKERTFSGGVGFPFAGNRVELHLGALHASRTSGTLSEGAWTISTGFGIRP